MSVIIQRLIQLQPEERDRDIWFQEEARAERQASVIRLIYMVAWLGVTAPAIPIHPPITNLANVGVGVVWLIWSVVYAIILARRPYRPAMKYLSTAIDVLLPTVILFLYHIEMGYSTSLKAPPFYIYLMVLALSALRFDFRLPIFGALLSILAYGGLIVYMTVAQGALYGTPYEMFTTPRINLVYQLYRLAYLAVMAVVLVILVQNVRRLVGLRVDEMERTLREKARREETQRLFERYFTPEIASYLIEHPQDLGGRTLPVTILTADLRGFTTLSEKLTPVQSVQVLNTLFERLTAIVFEYQGTLDKFLGDGMLVVFGTPEPRADDALRAVQAAQAIVQAVNELETGHTLVVGAAVHSGEVIFGNVGSPQRMELTVIGDAVNTAFRIEGLNKELGTQIILSETCYRQVADRVQAHALPEMTLRGKSETIGLYALDSAM